MYVCQNIQSITKINIPVQLHIKLSTLFTDYQLVGQHTILNARLLLAMTLLFEDKAVFTTDKMQQPLKLKI